MYDDVWYSAFVDSSQSVASIKKEPLNVSPEFCQRCVSPSVLGSQEVVMYTGSFNTQGTTIKNEQECLGRCAQLQPAAPIA